MAKDLQLVFRQVDGTGRKTISIPEPVANIDTLTTELENHMTQYVEGNVVSYPIFDEAHVVDVTTTELIDLMN